MLANAGCSTSYFDDLARRFAPAGFQIVAINMRGVGKSTGSLEGISLHDLAADVAGVIEVLGCAPANVLGHAFGNRVARCLAADRPDLVRSVILLAAGGLIGPPTPLGSAFRNAGEAKRSGPECAALGARWLSPASDPRVLEPVECWPMMHIAQIATSLHTPLEDWWTAGTHTPQVQDAFATAGATPSLGVELTVLDVVGWDLFSAVATPVPQFTYIKRTNSTINLTWSTVSGLSYQLLYTANLAPNVWTNLGSSITASGPSTSYTDTIGTTQRRFYRVELLNPPSTPSSAPASPAVDFAQVPLPPPTLRTNVLRPSMLSPAGQRRYQPSVISNQ